MPMCYSVDLMRAAFDLGRPAYMGATPQIPLVDGAPILGVFFALVLLGALLFDRRERAP